MMKGVKMAMQSIVERVMVSAIIVTVSYMYTESHLLFGKLALPVAGMFCLQIFLL